ncbi:MAG: oxidoreductase, partial [Mycobacterium sp.]
MAASDPLAPLAELPGVAEAGEAAREALALAHRHKTNRRGWPASASEAAMRAARATSVLDGASLVVAEDGEPDAVLAGALR